MRWHPWNPPGNARIQPHLGEVPDRLDLELETFLSEIIGMGGVDPGSMMKNAEIRLTSPDPTLYFSAFSAASMITAATSCGCDSYTEWLAPLTSVVRLLARS